MHETSFAAGYRRSGIPHAAPSPMIHGAPRTGARGPSGAPTNPDEMDLRSGDVDRLRKAVQSQDQKDPRLIPEKTTTKELRDAGIPAQLLKRKPQLRADLPDPTKPIFDRDERHIELLTQIAESGPKAECRKFSDAPPVIDRVYDTAMLKPDYTMLYVGKRREGKSYAMRWHLFSVRDQVPRGYVFTNTKINGFWQQFVPDAYVFPKYNSDIIMQIINQQKALLGWMRDHPEQSVNPNLFLVLDDCVTEDLFHDPALNTLFFEGRHVRIMVMMSTQYVRRIPPSMRENADVVICFRAHSEAQLTAICESWLGRYNKKEAERIIREYIWQEEERRQFMVVDTTQNLGEELFVGFAIDPDIIEPGWAMGSEGWWRHDRRQRLAQRVDRFKQPPIRLARQIAGTSATHLGMLAPEL